MRNKILLSLAIIFIATTIFTACEKETEIIEQKQSEQAENNLSDIGYSHGMLVFKSTEQYDSITANESGITKEEIINWQLKIGFVSQQSILEQALIEEEKFYEQFDPATMSEKEIDQVIKQKEAMGYTEYTKKWIADGIIKPLTYENISTLELTTVSAVLPIFLNLDGMIKIGNIIYQFTATQCKELRDGDFSKIELLKKAISVNKNLNIVIGNLTENSKDFHNSITPTVSKNNGYKYGSKMIESEIWIRRWDYPESNVKTYLYYTRYRNYKKNIWRVWKEDTDADTYHYILANASWNSGSKQGYISVHDNNFWAYNHHVIELYNIPFTEKVTFTINYSWFKRDEVDGIELLHLPYTL